MLFLVGVIAITGTTSAAEITPGYDGESADVSGSGSSGSGSSGSSSGSSSSWGDDDGLPIEVTSTAQVSTTNTQVTEIEVTSTTQVTTTKTQARTTQTQVTAGAEETTQEAAVESMDDDDDGNLKLGLGLGIPLGLIVCAIMLFVLYADAKQEEKDSTPPLLAAGEAGSIYAPPPADGPQELELLTRTNSYTEAHRQQSLKMEGVSHASYLV